MAHRIVDTRVPLVEGHDDETGEASGAPDQLVAKRRTAEGRADAEGLLSAGCGAGGDEDSAEVRGPVELDGNAAASAVGCSAAASGGRGRDGIYRKEAVERCDLELDGEAEALEAACHRALAIGDPVVLAF